MNKKLTIFFILGLTQIAQTTFEFSSKLSQILLQSNSSLTNTANISDVSGSIIMNDSSTIQGGTLEFANGGQIGNLDLNVSGTFSIDATTQLNSAQIEQNPITFKHGATIDLAGKVNLTSTWTIGENPVLSQDHFFTVIINGNGHTIDLSDPAARITIKERTCLILCNVTLSGISDTKFVFEGPNSTLKLNDSYFSISDDYTMTDGVITIQSDSTFVIGGNTFLFPDAPSLVVESGVAWLDTGGGVDNPVFGYIDGGSEFKTLINHLSIRWATDQSHVLDPGMALLLAGTPNPMVTIEGGTILTPNDQLQLTASTEVEANGTSVTFTNTDTPQVVIDPGVTAQFSNIEFLRIRQNTFEFSDDSSIIRFKNNVVLEFVEDVVYDKGSFEIPGSGNVVVFRGIGGKKKISFITSQNATNGGLLLGANNVILEDMEVDGLEFVSRDSAVIGGTLVEGKITMAEGALINMSFSTDMHFDIKGRNNKILLQENNLSLNGKVTFVDGFENLLQIGFGQTSDAEDQQLNLGANSMQLSCQNGIAGLRFDNDNVIVNNLFSNSFVTRYKSVIEGENITIINNPILNESDDFSLASGVNLISTDLPNPIELSNVIANPTETLSPYFTLLDTPFKGATTKAILIPRPRLSIKNALYGNNLRGTIALKSFSRINSFKPHNQEPLNLIMEGNTTVFTQPRATGTVAQILKNIPAISTNSDLIDSFKDGDTIFVTGTNNKIIVTGYLDMKGKIEMDEDAELIFEFDDSNDNEKAIIFSSSSGPFFQALPPTSSLVFQGSGSVQFADGSQLEFQGTSPEDLTALPSGLFTDNRPNLIVRNFAQLAVNGNKTLRIKGVGKVLAQDRGEIRILNGKIVMGEDEGDFFDLILDQGAGIRIGEFGTTTYTVPNLPSRFSFSLGSMNLRCDRGGEIAIRNGGIFETSLLNGEYKGGFVNTVLFDRNGKISLQNSGMFAMGQEDITEAPNNAAKFSWDISEGIVEGDGSVAIITEASTTPAVEAQLQPNTFLSTDISPFEVVKSMARITPDLIESSDYIDKVDNATKVITPNNRIVTLEDGDVIRREGPTTGNIYGTSAGGQRFVIFPDGTRQALT